MKEFLVAGGGAGAWDNALHSMRQFLTGFLCLSVVTGGVAGCGRPATSISEDGAGGAAYDRYRRPELLVAALSLHPGDVVADVGAGRGYLTFRLAEAVSPGGHVVATDTDSEVLQAIRAKKDSRITVRLTKPDDPGLELHAYDLILLSEVDHALNDRAAYFQRLIPSLKPGGRIAVSNRVPYRAAVELAAAQSHLRLMRDFRDLPAQFLLIYEVDK